MNSGETLHPSTPGHLSLGLPPATFCWSDSRVCPVHMHPTICAKAALFLLPWAPWGLCHHPTLHPAHVSPSPTASELQKGRLHPQPLLPSALPGPVWRRHLRNVHGSKRTGRQGSVERRKGTRLQADGRREVRGRKGRRVGAGKNPKREREGMQPPWRQQLPAVTSVDTLGSCFQSPDPTTSEIHTPQTKPSQSQYHLMASRAL